MAKKLGILAVHGVGDQSPDFADEMMDELASRISTKKGLGKNEFAWVPVYWAPEVATKQAKLWRRLKRGGPMDWRPIRRFLINFVADAAAYREIPGAPKSTYEKIHHVVLESIQELRILLDDKDCPIMIIAHSLGGLIMSNYIWDRQNWSVRNQKKPDPYVPNNNDFEKFNTLCAIVTFG